LQQDSKIKYQQIIELFNPLELVDIDEVETESAALHLQGKVELRNVAYKNVNGELILSGINLSIDRGKMISITGDFAIRRSRLAHILAGLSQPSSGYFKIDGKPLAEIPDSVLRRRLAFLGPDPHMFAGTIVDNLEYGLNQYEPEVPKDDLEQKLSFPEIAPLFIKVGLTIAKQVNRQESALHTGISQLSKRWELRRLYLIVAFMKC